MLCYVYSITIDKKKRRTKIGFLQQAESHPNQWKYAGPGQIQTLDIWGLETARV